LHAKWRNEQGGAGVFDQGISFKIVYSQRCIGGVFQKTVSSSMESYTKYCLKKNGAFIMKHPFNQKLSIQQFIQIYFSVFQRIEVRNVIK